VAGSDWVELDRFSATANAFRGKRRALIDASAKTNGSCVIHEHHRVVREETLAVSQLSYLGWNMGAHRLWLKTAHVAGTKRQFQSGNGVRISLNIVHRTAAETL
jgi:hypothetical protein